MPIRVRDWMASIRLLDLIPEIDDSIAYMRYRQIEDWCYDHIPKGEWRLDYSSTICVCGIDIPGRIFFWNEADAVTFRLVFSS